MIVQLEFNHQIQLFNVIQIHVLVLDGRIWQQVFFCTDSSIGDDLNSGERYDTIVLPLNILHQRLSIIDHVEMSL
jgi:hypothetical protein